MSTPRVPAPQRLGRSATAPVRPLALALTLALALGTVPARANPLDSGPVADFLNVFRTQAIDRETVRYAGREAPGTVVVSTSQRRLY